MPFSFIRFGKLVNKLLIFNKLQFIFVTEVAELYPLNNQYGQKKMAGYLYQTPLGKKSGPALQGQGYRKLLPFKQSAPKMERPDETGGRALV